jgi:predicted nucleic acid-binding protein
VILIDSNVLIDIFGSEQAWYQWSYNAVAMAGARDQLAINIVTVAEVAPRLGSLDVFKQKLGIIRTEIVESTSEAAYLAGEAFDIHRSRRKRGEEKGGAVLPDFLIGGQALVLGATIITRDARFYRTYFPTVPLITPETTEP